MNKKTLIYSVLVLLIFVFLIGYNYLVAQKKIKDTKPSPLTISYQSFPESVIVGRTGTFAWDIDSSPDLFTTKTTIYYGPNASPSALTQVDSPEAVGYPYFQVDYAKGSFQLPNSFDLSIMFNTPGKIYFRAYAKVGNSHLWTEEKSLLVLPNSKNVGK